MDARRFDAITRCLARPASRRSAMAGGLAAALAALQANHARRPGFAQSGASPIASPGASPMASPIAPPATPAAASPGPLDLLAGTPAAEGELLGRSGTCMNRRMECPGNICGAALSCAYDRCCSGTCRYWLIPDWPSPFEAANRWYCD